MTYDRYAFGHSEDAIFCDRCGTEIEPGEEHEYNGIVCMDCLLERMGHTLTYDNAFKYGSENTESVEINGFALYMLGESKINEILEDYIRQIPCDEFDDCKEYAYQKEGLEEWGGMYDI